MRRSARISARKGLAVSAVQSQASDPVEVEEVSAEEVVAEKEPKRKVGKTQRIGKATRCSVRKNADPVDTSVIENDTPTTLGSIPGVSLQEVVGNTEDRLEMCNGKKITKLVSDNVIKLNENSVSCEETKGENESQPCKNYDHQELQTEMESACGEQEAIYVPPINDSISGFDLKQSKPLESESFIILSKKEIDLKKTTGNVKTDGSSTEKETNRSVLGIKDKRTESKSAAVHTTLDYKTTDDGFGSSDVALPIASQVSSQERMLLKKKHPRIQSRGKFAVGHQSLQINSSNRTLLKLTSEIFEKIPFKITKEDLLANRLPKNGSKSKFTNHDSKDNGDEDVLQKDVISVTVDDKEISDVKKKMFALSSELDPRVKPSELYFKLGKNGTASTSRESGKISREKEANIMKNSVIGSDFEQKAHSCARESKAKKIKERKRKAKETAGKGWYNLPKTKMTDEVKRDIQVLKMRSVLDPKRFYKKGDKRISKYFQVGTVVSGAADFYSSRIPKKDRKRSMVDQLLADAEFRRRNKRKYLEIQEQRANTGGKYHKKGRNKRKEKRGRT